MTGPSVAASRGPLCPQLFADDALDIFGGLRLVACRVAAGKLHGELGEQPLQALRIARLWRLRHFDGVLQFVGQQRDRATLRTLRLDSNMEIAMVPWATMLWAR